MWSNSNCISYIIRIYTHNIYINVYYTYKLKCNYYNNQSKMYPYFYDNFITI